MLAVDDQAVFRRALRELIAAAPGFEQVAEAASGPEAIERARELDPDLALLDVRMPEMDGTETARRLAMVARRTRIVLISLDPAELERPAADVPAAALVRKQDLSVATLRSLWERLSAVPAAR